MAEGFWGKQLTEIEENPCSETAWFFQAALSQFGDEGWRQNVTSLASILGCADLNRKRCMTL
jgi:hypothetical protein